MKDLNTTCNSREVQNRNLSLNSNSFPVPPRLMAVPVRPLSLTAPRRSSTSPWADWTVIKFMGR